MSFAKAQEQSKTANSIQHTAAAFIGAQISAETVFVDC